MTTVRSRKSKGRRLQISAAKAVRARFGLEDRDAVSAPASVPGEDIILSEKAKKVFPFSVECKNQEKVNIWEALAQAERNAKDGRTPIVVFSRNNAPTYVALDFDVFLALVAQSNMVNIYVSE